MSQTAFASEPPPARPPASLVGSLRRLARLASVVVIAIGALVILGWVFDVELLKTLMPGAPVMSASSALGFVLAGVALSARLRARPERRGLSVLSRSCALLVLLLGLANLIGYEHPWSFSLDRFFALGEPDFDLAAGPQRMALNTALNFLLCGAALLCLDVETRRGVRPAQLLFLVTGLVALVAVTGYAYHVLAFYRVGGNRDPMALNSGLTFLLLCLAGLCAHPGRGLMGLITGQNAGGLIARRLLPAALLIPLALGTLRFWGQRADLFATETGVALFIVSNMVIFAALSLWMTWALNRMERGRQRAEIALRDSEALYRSLVDTLPINLIRKDLQGRITFSNRHYCEAIGKPLAELAGKTDFDFFPAELAEKYVKDDRNVIATRQVFEDIELHQQPGGQRSFVHVLKAPVLDAAGAVIGTQVIFWDVTARKKAEEALERTAADLARSNRELEQFAYVASHDLQEPLRMIASFTQLLARRYQDKLDEEAREFIGYAVDGAIRMQQLIHELLAFSRLGTLGCPFEPVEGEKVLLAALTNLKVALAESGAALTHDPLPAVRGDALQLVQLFQNLLGNALKFRGPAPPKIHISVARQPADPGSDTEAWVFCVRDNGIGIEPQFFERIFVIFARLHTRDEYPGVGIGLAICKKVVERHGGRIWVASQPGHGSQFYFTLPVA
jgi:PAS domain S-box-containing protein